MDFDSSNPHDALFRAAFAEPERAADLLRRLLPPEAAAAIDWQSLQRLPESFVDGDLRDCQADLVFSVETLGAPCLIYVLFEHKSAPDPWVPLQLLRYVLRLWDAWRGARPDADHLPPILPLVLYNGMHPWRGPRSLRDLVGGAGLPAALMELQPDLFFRLEDLTQRTPRQLRRMQYSVATLLTLLHLKQLRTAPAGAPLLVRWRRLYRLLSASATPGARQLLVQLVSYVFYVAPDDHEPIAAALRAIEPIVREIDMTVADKLIAKGEAKGEAKGRAEGEAKGLRTALTMYLTTRFGELAEARRAGLEAADAATLRHVMQRALAAATLDEVFAD